MTRGAHGPYVTARVPLYVVDTGGGWTIVAAATVEQARLLGIGWVVDRGVVNARFTVRARRARASDIELARMWAADGDEDAKTMLRLAGLARPERPPAPAAVEAAPAGDEQLALI